MRDPLARIVVVDEVKTPLFRSRAGATDHGRAAHRHRVEGATPWAGRNEVFDDGENLGAAVWRAMGLVQCAHDLATAQLMQYQTVNLQ